jgi:hypothetical protein
LSFSTPEQLVDGLIHLGRDPVAAKAALNDIEHAGGIDSLGRIPIVDVSGRFQSHFIDAHITDTEFGLLTTFPGFPQERTSIPFTVSERNALSVRKMNGPEYFRIG